VRRGVAGREFESRPVFYSGDRDNLADPSSMTTVDRFRAGVLSRMRARLG